MNLEGNENNKGNEENEANETNEANKDIEGNGVNGINELNGVNKDNLFINELTDKIANIIKSPNKNDFIKKYNECHKQIKMVDEILYSPNVFDSNMDIKVLFEMLKEYEILIEKGDISIQEYKNMCDIVELVENKMKNLSMEIKEIQ
jgi:hypothetical protein